MSATLVGDPGAEKYFQGVALTRCKGTVTPEDEATAEHLVDELKKLATKMGRLLACLRLTTTCGGGQEALVDSFDQVFSILKNVYVKPVQRVYTQ